MSSEFAKKQGFKLKSLERLMHIKDINGLLNKEEPMEHMVEVNIYYQRHRERMEIDMIGEQKWIVILGMLWLAHHNPKINWKTGEVKMTRCSEKCGRQWRPKQEKPGWQKQKKEEAKEEIRRKQKRRKVVEVKKSGKEVGDLERRRGSSKIKGRSKKDGAQEVSPMDKDIWEEKIRENANKKSVGLYNRGKRGVYTKEGEGLPIIKGRKRRSV